MAKVDIVNWNNDYNETMEVFQTSEDVLQSFKANFEIADLDEDDEYIRRGDRHDHADTHRGGTPDADLPQASAGDARGRRQRLEQDHGNASAAGKHVVIGAGDALSRRGRSSGCKSRGACRLPLITAPKGSDAASLVFGCAGAVEAEGADLLLLDIAGQPQNREDLTAYSRDRPREPQARPKGGDGRCTLR
jgi:hypothetical protein